jgi:hypothetical protein
MQSKLFDSDDVIEDTWNDKFPCPICETAKMHFSRTSTHLYITCSNHHTFRREYSEGEFDGKFD